MPRTAGTKMRTVTMAIWNSLLSILLLAQPAIAASPGPATCRPMMFEGMGYVLCEVDAGQDLRPSFGGFDDRQPLAADPVLVHAFQI